MHVSCLDLGSRKINQFVTWPVCHNHIHKNMNQCFPNVCQSYSLRKGRVRYVCHSAEDDCHHPGKYTHLIRGIFMSMFLSEVFTFRALSTGVKNYFVSISEYQITNHLKYFLLTCWYYSVSWRAPICQLRRVNDFSVFDGRLFILGLII